MIGFPLRIVNTWRTSPPLSGGGGTILRAQRGVDRLPRFFILTSSLQMGGIMKWLVRKLRNWWFCFRFRREIRKYLVVKRDGNMDPAIYGGRF